MSTGTTSKHVDIMDVPPPLQSVLVDWLDYLAGTGLVGAGGPALGESEHYWHLQYLPHGSTSVVAEMLVLKSAVAALPGE